MADDLVLHRSILDLPLGHGRRRLHFLCVLLRVLNINLYMADHFFSPTLLTRLKGHFTAFSLVILPRVRYASLSF